MVDITRQSMLGAIEIKISVWLIAIIIALSTFVISVYLTKRIGRNIVYRF